jgi:VanZ family protein
MGVPLTALRLVFWGTLAGVVVLSLTPLDYLPPQVFNIWDKAQHAFAFLVLGVLGLWSYPGRDNGLLAGLIVLGGAIELAQAATGWRYGEWADLFADGVGVCVAAATWHLVNARLTSRTG